MQVIMFLMAVGWIIVGIWVGNNQTNLIVGMIWLVGSIIVERIDNLK